MSDPTQIDAFLYQQLFMMMQNQLLNGSPPSMPLLLQLSQVWGPQLLYQLPMLQYLQMLQQSQQMQSVLMAQNPQLIQSLSAFENSQVFSNCPMLQNSQTMENPAMFLQPQLLKESEVAQHSLSVSAPATLFAPPIVTLPNSPVVDSGHNTLFPADGATTPKTVKVTSQVNIKDVDVTSKNEWSTREIASRVKLELKMYGISQHTFAEVIFNKTQGTMSELLNKPKPWEALSAKGKQTYRKMEKWLNTSEGEKKKLREDAIVKLEGSRKPDTKKIQHYQREVLKKAFWDNERPSKAEQKKLADEIGLKPATVANFFMNARCKNRTKYVFVDVFPSKYDTDSKRHHLNGL